jgi:hypothetical protein
MAPSPQQRLDSYERRYRQLAAQLADLGLISAATPDAPHPAANAEPTHLNHTGPTGN